MLMSPRALAVAFAALVVFWFAFDSGFVNQEPALPGRSLALAILAAVFGLTAFMMQKAGAQTNRIPWLFGLALGIATYLLMHAITP
jgi:hypothetical protein